MRVAFYAPLKPPDHPTPSGDREMARALLALLEQAGHQPFLASRLRTFDRTGDALRQRRLARIGAAEARRVLRRIDRGLLPCPGLWLTYHSYHKAPDHLGPSVASRLRIPYAIVEASCGPRQASGPWALGHAAALAALRRADVVLAMTERDRPGLAAAMGGEERIHRLPPFIDTGPFRDLDRERQRRLWATRLALPPGAPLLLAVAMMRDDVKRRSYALLSDALGRCLDRTWMLAVAGDGPARPAIAAELAGLGPDRTRLLGRLDRAALPGLYAACDLLVWPGLEEAYGLVFLEAGAAGLPVVACREGGVPEIVEDGLAGRLVAGRDPAAFAATIRSLLDDPGARARLGEAGRARIESHHGTAAAAAALASGLASALARQHP